MLHATLTGRLGRDAELRNTQSGEKVLGFSVATDDGYGQNKTTLWIDCSIWGKRAESLAQYLVKGTAVTAVGTLGQRSYKAKDGTEKTGLTLKVTEIDFSRPADAKGDRATTSTETSAKPGRVTEDLDDDIPW